jgi:hypothetical protein
VFPRVDACIQLLPVGRLYDVLNLILQLRERVGLFVLYLLGNDALAVIMALLNQLLLVGNDARIQVRDVDGLLPVTPLVKEGNDGLIR